MRVLGTMLLTAVVVVMLGMNVWFVNERLEVKFYQKGLRDGRSALANQVITQVEKTGRLLVTLPSGKEIPMVAQRSPTTRGPGIGDIFGGMAAAKTATASDPNEKE